MSSDLFPSSISVDAVVERADLRVLRVKADMQGKGPPAAFELLESKLPSLKGRRFYGSFLIVPGGEEYYACVERVDTDDPEKMHLDNGVLPGGWYVRRKVTEWEPKISQFPEIFSDLAKGQEVDPTRPSLEFYRSRIELHLLLPVRAPRPRAPPPESGGAIPTRGPS
jgi:hypothetical protein